MCVFTKDGQWKSSHCTKLTYSSFITIAVVFVVYCNFAQYVVFYDFTDYVRLILTVILFVTLNIPRRGAKIS